MTSLPQKQDNNTVAAAMKLARQKEAMQIAKEKAAKPILMQVHQQHRVTFVNAWLRIALMLLPVKDIRGCHISCRRACASLRDQIESWIAAK